MTRAHALAHLMWDWVSAFRITPDRRDRPSTWLLGRSIEDAAARLSPGARTVFLLHDVEGYTHEEIATQLGRTNSSVYGLHHRGRRALCAELERLDSTPQTEARGRIAVAA